MVNAQQNTKSSVFSPLALSYSLWGLVEGLAVISFLAVFASVSGSRPRPRTIEGPSSTTQPAPPQAQKTKSERSRLRKRTVSFSDMVDVRIVGPFYAEQMPRSGSGELFSRRIEQAVFDVRLTPHLSIMQLLNNRQSVIQKGRRIAAWHDLFDIKPGTSARQMAVVNPPVVQPLAASSPRKSVVARNQGKKLVEACAVPLGKALTRLRKCGKVFKPKTKLTPMSRSGREVTAV